MLKKFILWLKPTFEDANGTASYRRLTALVFTLLICYMIMSNYIQTMIHLHAFFGLLVSVLLLIGIITAQNIITIIKGQNGSNALK